MLKISGPSVKAGLIPQNQDIIYLFTNLANMCINISADSQYLSGCRSEGVSLFPQKAANDFNLTLLQCSHPLIQTACQEHLKILQDGAREPGNFFYVLRENVCFFRLLSLRINATTDWRPYRTFSPRICIVSITYSKYHLSLQFCSLKNLYFQSQSWAVGTRHFLSIATTTCQGVLLTSKTKM